jgi:uncharacterized protein YciI
VKSRYLLLYDVVEDYLERRAALRDEHLRLANESHARGELELAGAHADPKDDSIDGAVLVFTTDDPRVPEKFAEADPYVINHLVTRWRVRRWNTVVGAGR